MTNRIALPGSLLFAVLSAAGCSQAPDDETMPNAAGGGALSPAAGGGAAALGVGGQTASAGATNASGAVSAAGGNGAATPMGVAGSGETAAPTSVSGMAGSGNDAAGGSSREPITPAAGGASGETGDGSNVEGTPGASTGSPATTDITDPTDTTSGMQATSPGDTSAEVTTQPPTEAPAEEGISCPADATFCTGFELPMLPQGVSFEPRYMADMANGEVLNGTLMALDTSVARSGLQSLHVPAGANGYQYRMLAVPVPNQAFWVRLWVRTSDQFGDANHDTIYMGSRLPVGEYNEDAAVEISEQSNQMLLNQRDALYAASGPGDPAGTGAPGPVIPANTWVCMESLFDASADVVQVYMDGELVIDASDYAGTQPYQTFRFGYLSFNQPRDVWYDDVVIAASRVGCD